MALTKSTLPGLPPTIASPYDTLQAFALSQTITTSGYANNVNTQLNIGPGRFDGIWTINVTAVYMTSSDESYKLYLLGSNDQAWGSGNIDILAAYDIAATAGLRTLATICAATPAIPPTGLTAMRIVRPFLNQTDAYVFQYQQMYVATAGTTPSITLSSWISSDELG